MNIYFDETNHSRKISISKNGEQATYNTNNENWFYYVFLGVKNQPYVERAFVELEQKFFNKVEGIGEIKSSTILSKISHLKNLNTNKKISILNF